MNEAVDRLIEERQRLEQGFSGSLGLSVLAHLLLVGGAIAAPFLLPKEPMLRVQEGFAVPMPPGGGGVRAETPPPATPPAPKVEPPPKVLKPPNPEKKTGLPAPDAKPAKRKPEPSPTHAAEPGPASPQTPGLEFGPPGPGVPGGTDPLGDWYLAGVQRKIWMVWMQQIRTGMTQPVTVRFTILADGAVSDVEVVQSSGAFLLNTAAQRAILTAAPFAPLPKDYGTNRLTIQAIFKPTN